VSKRAREQEHEHEHDGDDAVLPLPPHPDVAFVDRPPTYLEWCYYLAARQGNAEALLRLAVLRRQRWVSEETIMRLTYHEMMALVPRLYETTERGFILEELSMKAWDRLRPEADESWREAVERFLRQWEVRP
jgi:hypothetical protein